MSVQRILIALPETPMLVHSSSLALESRGPRIDRSELEIHPAFHLDQSFAAAPIVAQDPARFVVRGMVEMDDLPAVLSTAGNRGYEVFADPEIGLLPACNGTAPIGRANDVKRLLGLGALQAAGFDGSNVAIAVIDSGINLASLRSLGLAPNLDAHIGWSPARTITPGAAPADHGTMCAYDIAIAAPKAILLDFAVTMPTRQDTMMNGYLSDAMTAYGVLLKLMLKPDGERPFQSLVVNNSWAMMNPTWDFAPGSLGRYGDNPNHPFFQQVGSLVAAGADVLFAAGNCGPACPDRRCLMKVDNSINGANSHPDVITVAGVDTTDALAGFSSQGPGVLSEQKPDLAAYTHFLGSKVFGPTEADSGTSAACAVLSGVVAALRTAVPFDRTKANRSPAALKRFLLDNARRPDGLAVPWTRDIGWGLPANLQQAQASLS